MESPSSVINTTTEFSWYTRGLVDDSPISVGANWFQTEGECLADFRSAKTGEGIYVQKERKRRVVETKTLSPQLKQMESLLDILTAEKTMHKIEKLTKDLCHGCFIDHPSQTQHSCLMDTFAERLDSVFDEALDSVWMSHLVDEWMKYVTHTDFAANLHPVYLIKYSCSEWLEKTYKCDEWRARIRNLLLQIYD